MMRGRISRGHCGSAHPRRFAGRLITVWNSYNQTTTLTHDAMGREVQRTLANGVSVNRTFDAAGRETTLLAVNAAGAALSGYTATYDPAGNRLTVLELDGTRVTYTNDASYQLTREQRGGAHPIDETLSYDPVGNRVSKVDGTGTTTYQLNAANELVLTTPPTGAPTTSTWDADGNLAVENTGGPLTTHTWDTDNRLVRIDKPDGTWETNTYRADGLRQSHEDTDGLVHFVWDGQNVLLEKNSFKVTRAIYTQLPGIWGGAFSYRRGADHYYLLPDFQGHTRHMANAAGAIFEPHIYDAWGREIWPIVTTGLYLRGFGQWGYWRDATSRLYVRARHLRVELGRWVSRDPVPGRPGGSAFGYADQRALTALDPSGRTLGVWVDGSVYPKEHPGRQQTDPQTRGADATDRAIQAALSYLLTHDCVISPATCLSRFLGLGSGPYPISVEMTIHWLGRTGSKVYLPMEQWLPRLPEQRAVCSQYAKSAAQYAGSAPTRHSHFYEGYGKTLGKGNIAFNGDVAWAVGGVSGYAEADACCVGETCSRMCLCMINDTLTMKAKMDGQYPYDHLHHLHLGKLAKDFFMDGPVLRSYVWRAGHRDGTAC